MNNECERTLCNCNENILLECTAGLDVGPLNSITGILASTPVPLGTINVKSKDLCNSSVLLTFTGELSATIGLIVNPTFNIIKNTCNSINETISTFSINTITSFANTESFSFQYCDDNFCNDCDCVSYTLILIPGALVAGVNLTVRNVVISAKEINNNDNCKVISKCLSNISVPTISNISPELSFQPIAVGSLSIDVKDLCNPKILFTFSGILSATGDGVIGFTEQIFRVTRRCKDITKVISGTLGAGTFTLLNEESFSYQICDSDCSDCLDCDCITYTIEVLPGIVPSFRTIVLKNVNLSAFATEKDSNEFNCTKGNSINKLISQVPLNTNPINNLEIGSISINKCDICLNKILLTFSGDISGLGIFLLPEPTPISIDLSFAVIRQCDGTSQQIGPIFNALSRSLTVGQPAITEAFSYQVCDCDIPTYCDCLTYTIKLLSTAIILPIVSINVGNVTISTFTKNSDCEN